jgi:uncharacterized delta-60 repeat protein
MSAPKFTRWQPSLTRLEGRENPSGGLDLSFSGDAKQTYDFGHDDQATAVAVQSDGKVLVAGTWGGGGDDFAIVRYLPNGSLDSTFGTNGRQTIDFGSTDVCTGLAVQADGKIVLVGYTDFSAVGANDVAVARLNANGTLDTTFNGDGMRRVNFSGAYDDRASGVVIQPDGKIVIAATWGIDASDSELALIRLNPNGTLDSSINTGNGNGRASAGFANAYAVTTGIALQADGKIVLVGYTDFDPTAGTDVAVARFNGNDGSLDLGFDGDGKRSLDFGGNYNDRASGVVIQPDGKIVIATLWGTASADADFGFIRLMGGNGAVDASFSSVNGNGRASTNFGGADLPTGIALQPDGKIVISGYTNANGTNDFAVARFNSNGQPDTTFSTDGMQTVPFGGGDKANGMAVQKDGRIVLAGSTSVGQDFAVARLIGRDTALIGRTAVGGWWTNRPNATASGFTVGAATGWNESVGWKDVQSGDVDGDGVTDLVGRTSNGQWWVSRRSANGTYATSLWAGWNEAANWKDVRVVDVTGDGKADVIGRSSDGGWWVGTSVGTAFATSQWGGWNEAANWRDVQFADVTGDGLADVVGRASDGSWWVGRSNGTAFTTTQWGGWNEAAGWRDVRIADVNGDGRADVVGRTAGGEWWVGTSSGTAFTNSLFAGWNEAANWKDVRVGDFNGDGRADVVGRASDGSWWVGRSTGTAFTTTQWGGWNEAAGWRDVTVGDFNGDGRMDLAGRTSGGQWYVGTSTGSAFATTLWANWNEAAGWKDVLAGPFVG